MAEMRLADQHVTADGRLTTVGAAALIGIKHDTLKNWRSQGKGPPHFRAGQVWYRVDDVLDWIDEQERRCTEGH